MSVHATSWAWAQGVGDAKAKLVLVKLADNANDDFYCWPGWTRLCAETELSRATVARKLKLLKDAGLIEVVQRRKPDGTRTSNGYRLLRQGLSLRPGDGSRSQPETLGAGASRSQAETTPRLSVRPTPSQPETRTVSRTVKRTEGGADAGKPPWVVEVLPHESGGPVVQSQAFPSFDDAEHELEQLRLQHGDSALVELVDGRGRRVA